jgi:archaellum component FlaC
MKKRTVEELTMALQFMGVKSKRLANRINELERENTRLNGLLNERKVSKMNFTLDLHLADDKIKEYLGVDTIKADELETTIKELIYRYERLNDDYNDLEDLYSDTKKELDHTEEEFRDYKQYVEDNYKHESKEEQING